MGQRDRESTSSGSRSGNVGVSAPNTDCLFKTKRFGVTLSKDDFILLRTTLFRYDLSMQEVFGELARRIIDQTDSGVKYLNEMVKIKLQRKIDGYKRPEQGALSEQDIDVLYDLIEEGSKKKNDDYDDYNIEQIEDDDG